MPQPLSTIQPDRIFSKRLLHHERNRVEFGIYNGKGVVLKTFCQISIFNRIFYALIRPSKAKRAFENAKKLLEMGFLTPSPIDYNDVIYFKVWLHQSWLVTEWESFDFSFRELIERPSVFFDWELIVRETAKFVLDLYKKQVLFKDLSPGNILYKREGKNYKIYLVDINRMSFCRVSYTLGVKNLSKLSLTTSMIPIFVREFARYYQKPEYLVEQDICRVIRRFERNKKIKSFVKSLFSLLI